MAKQIDREKESGKIWIENGIIHYWSEYFKGWEVPITKIKIIGEYTNQDGPFLDDYFLVFIVNPEECFEASFYAEGRDKVLAEVGKTIGIEIKLFLTNSADFKSRVIWPVDLAGEAIFEFYEQPPKGVVNHIKKLLGIGTVWQCFTSKAQEYLQQKSEQEKINL